MLGMGQAIDISHLCAVSFAFFERHQRLVFTVSLSMLGSVNFACRYLRNPPAERPDLVSEALEDKLGWMLSYDVRLLTVDSLTRALKALRLDTRTPEEFAVSHLPGATWVDPAADLPAWLDTLPRNFPIAVYCSVGYRSEKYAHKLADAGFTEVSNLYGSIFEWVDRGNPIVDSTDLPTFKLHTYNKRWARYVEAPGYQKIW